MTRKYKVIKPFTKYDYIVAHQKQYKWNLYKDSCEEFQEDMKKWQNEECLIDTITKLTDDGEFSENFYTHACRFGFLEEEKEEYYSLGDRFKWIENAESYILCRVDINEVNLFNLSDGNRWKEPLTVDNVINIPAKLFHSWAGSGWRKER